MDIQKIKFTVMPLERVKPGVVMPAWDGWHGSTMVSITTSHGIYDESDYAYYTEDPQ
jgi:hypothetical protein